MSYFVETVHNDDLEEFLRKIAARSGTDGVVSVCSDNKLVWFKIIYKAKERIY